MIVWLRQHRQALRAALRTLRTQGFAGVLNALGLGIALSLPVGGYVLVTNLQSVSAAMPLSPELSVFAQPGLSPERLKTLGTAIGTHPLVAGTRFVSRDDALRAIGDSDDLRAVVGSLASNPLPDTFVVRARETGDEALDRLAGVLRALPGVERVQLDALWARRLNALTGLAEVFLSLLAGLLGAAVVANAFNTIRLQTLTQRDEIEVALLIGATDGFVRRPMLYFGTLQGLAGGLVALAVVWGALAWLNLDVAALAQTYGSRFRLAYLAAPDAVLIAAAAGALGWIGSYLSVSKHLRNS